jgi:hypothetical protein
VDQNIVQPLVGQNIVQLLVGQNIVQPLVGPVVDDNKDEVNVTKKWFMKYEKLKEWIATYKKYPQFGTMNKLEEILVTFIYNSRYLYNRNKLSEDRIKKLELLPGWQWHKNNDKK